MLRKALGRKEIRMSQKVMLVEKERFLLNDRSKYMVTGKIPKGAEIEC